SARAYDTAGGNQARNQVNVSVSLSVFRRGAAVVFTESDALGSFVSAFDAGERWKTPTDTHIFAPNNRPSACSQESKRNARVSRHRASRNRQPSRVVRLGAVGADAQSRASPMC